MRHTRLIAAVLLLAAALPALGGGEEQAVQQAFPQAARLDKTTLFLDAAEQERTAELARAPVDSGLFNVYRALGPDGRLLGYAFIDSRTVRTKPATFLVALGPDGRVREVRVLGWGEPGEYRPGERWLGQFRDRGLDGELRLGAGVQAMSGASFTSRTLTDGVRRILAIYKLKLAARD
ncbi:MAG TPA: FMN-binding protein [Gammaproteobacteria bacterium]|nr:FMN-binding protein [Gammaproteobacteria bacterium]